jgi:HSP20 family molecular chaperone IbpA
MDILQFHTLFLPQFQVPLIFQFSSIAASISSEREPLADVTTTDKEVKVIAVMPGVNKENIKVNVYDNSLEVTTIQNSKINLLVTYIGGSSKGNPLGWPKELPMDYRLFLTNSL